MDSLHEQAQRMPWFPFVAGLLLLFFSTTGILSNLIFFIYTVNRPKFRFAFYTFCRTKAIANVIMAVSFLLWPTVCSFLGFLYLPPFYNILIGQFAGIGVYIVGPIVQLLITLNRTLATCFPIYFAKSSYGNYVTWLTILISCGIGAFFFFIGLKDGCAFVFNMDLLSWMVQDADCAVENIYLLLYTIAGVWTASSIFNLCTFVQIMRITRRIKSTARETVVAKEKRNRVLFIQNIILDSFVLIDMLMVTFAAGWSDALWYKFFINSLLWIWHINADGAVMFLYNVKIRKEKVNLITRSDTPLARGKAPSSVQ